jgi:hypothetical protein
MEKVAENKSLSTNHSLESIMVKDHFILYLAEKTPIHCIDKKIQGRNNIIKR